MAASPDARLFVLFMDLYHVRVEGSHRAQGPIIRLLDRVIGQDDLVGVMTSDMTPRELTLGRRTDTIATILREYWYWGQSTFERKLVEDPVEEGLRHCYPEQTEPGLASGVIKRLREQQMLDALGNLIEHLEAIREERKFVILLTEGWQLFKPSEALQRPTKKADGSAGFAPGLPPPLGVNPQTGQLGVTNDASAWDVCERQRSLAAMLDNEQHFRTLVQRANRANVSFYPIDTRGLVVFDSDIRDPLPLALDLAVLRTKHENLRVLAGETDGFAVVDTGNIDRALERMVADTSLVPPPRVLLHEHSARRALSQADGTREETRCRRAGSAGLPGADRSRDERGHATAGSCQNRCQRGARRAGCRHAVSRGRAAQNTRRNLSRQRTARANRERLTPRSLDWPAVRRHA